MAGSTKKQYVTSARISFSDLQRAAINPGDTFSEGDIDQESFDFLVKEGVVTEVGAHAPPVLDSPAEQEA